MKRVNKLREFTSYLYHLIKFQLNSSKRNDIIVKPMSETIDFILSNNCSLGRYGDGELNMVRNYIESCNLYTSEFQKYDPLMGKRLFEILQEGGNEEFNFYVGLPSCMYTEGTNKLTRKAATFWRYYSDKNVMTFHQIIPKNKFFLDTQISRFYLDLKKKKDCHKYFEYLQKIWDRRNVLIIEGEKTHFGVRNNLLSNSASIRRIIAPATNAFQKYNEILEGVKQEVHKDDLILCSLGMTATILAYDLAKAGYQTIDIGHIDIEYEWMLMNAKEKVPVHGKYTNEAENGKEVKEESNSEYLNSIIKKIL